MFRLKIHIPSATVFDEDIDFLRAQDSTGSFSILSRHTDFLTILRPSVLIIKKKGKELYFAIKGGILSFRENTATLSTESAIKGDTLEELHKLVQEHYLKITEKERMLGETITNMERGFLKRLVELEREYG
ncbi:MAG: hypothetical protein D6710_10055 [Nitrospirae bacterium]|nr:MAG: hypothetical protein D6710_10055 [Nitrospirota bacterium]